MSLLPFIRLSARPQHCNAKRILGRGFRHLLTQGLATRSPSIPLSDTQTVSRAPALDPRKLAQLKRPTRGGQNLSRRYQRLERSLRGKTSFGRTIEGFERSGEIVEPAPYTTGEGTQETNTSIGKVTRRIFRGFVVPDPPKPPAEDECCMSGCTICVYDLYDEARNDYIQAMEKFRTDLTKLDVPRSEWPADVRGDTEDGGSTTAPKPNAALSAFEQLELALKAKREAQETAGSNPAVVPPLLRKHPRKKKVGVNDVVEGLRWVLFSNR